jgi:hypothetical protein
MPGQRRLEAAAGAPSYLGRAGRLALAHRVLREQVRAADADVVYAQDLFFLRARELGRMRAEGRVLVGQIASAPPGLRRLRRYDLLLSAFPHFVERFRAEGIAAEVLPIGFHAAVLDRLAAAGVDASPGSPRPHGVSFVGGLDPAVHVLRVPLLERLAREIEIDVWGYGSGALPSGSPVLDRYRGEAWGLDMYRVFADSRIVINVHEDVAEGKATNMRLYEATGSGALLMTENYENLPELFEPGREVVAYDGPDDLVQKVRHYLAHDDERERIAAAGQARTLADHTYAERVRRLEPMLEAAVSRGPGA